MPPGMFSLVWSFGLRQITVYALVAMIGHIQRFDSPKKLAAYLGVSPSYKLSGLSVRKRGICHRGRPEIRALLAPAGQAVLNCKGQSNPLYTWAWHLAKRRSRGHAVIAIARQLVTAVWYTLRGNVTPITCFEESMTLRWKIEHLARRSVRRPSGAWGSEPTSATST